MLCLILGKLFKEFAPYAILLYVVCLPFMWIQDGCSEKKEPKYDEKSSLLYYHNVEVPVIQKNFVEHMIKKQNSSHIFYSGNSYVRDNSYMVDVKKISDNNYVLSYGVMVKYGNGQRRYVTCTGNYNSNNNTITNFRW